MVVCCAYHSMNEWEKHANWSYNEPKTKKILKKLEIRTNVPGYSFSFDW